MLSNAVSTNKIWYPNTMYDKLQKHKYQTKVPTYTISKNKKYQHACNKKYQIS